MDTKVEKKKSYFLGTLGAMLGGLVLTIPLIFAYINFKSSIFLGLSVLLPVFEFYGYKWFKGKIDKKSPIILLILTIINVLIMTLLFIPIVLAIKANLPFSIIAIKSSYMDNKTALAMVQDCLICIAISMVGVYIVSEVIKRKLLLNSSNIDLFSTDNKEKIDLKEKAINKLKPKFEKARCYAKGENNFKTRTTCRFKRS